MSDKADRLTRYGVTVLAVLGGLALLGIIAIVVLIAGDRWSSPPEPPRTVQAGPHAEIFRVGDVTPVAGTPFVRMILSTDAGERGSYSSSESDQRNVVVLDTTTGRSRRLLPDNSRRIISTHYLPAAASRRGSERMVATASDDAPPEVFYLFEVQRRDGILREVIVGRIDGGPAVTVLQGIDGLDSSWMIDPSHAAVIVRERNRLVYRKIDMVARTATPAVPIEIGR